MLSALLRRRSVRLARNVSVSTKEAPDTLLLKSEFLHPQLVEDLKQQGKKSLKRPTIAKTFNDISFKNIQTITDVDRKEIAWTSSYDPVKRSPFVKDVVHLQSLLDALVASKNFDRADSILRAVYPLLESPEMFVPIFNKYLEAYIGEESATIEDVERYISEFRKEHPFHLNDRTHALLIAKSMGNEAAFDKWVARAKHSKQAFRNTLNQIDVITMECLSAIFRDANLDASYVPVDLLPLYHEARTGQNHKDVSKSDNHNPAQEDAPQYFTNDKVDAPVLDKDARHLRAVDSFGIKVIRHTLLGLKSASGADMEQLLHQLGTGADAHLLHGISGEGNATKKNTHEMYKALKTPEDRQRFNEVLEMLNEERQKSLEARGIEGARAKWKHEFETLHQRGEISMNKNLNVQLYKWYSDMLPLVEEEHALCTKLVHQEVDTATLSKEEAAQMKERAHYAPYLILVPPQTLCVLTIFELLKLNSTGGIVDGMRATRAVISVGRAVELEYKSQQLMKAEKKHTLRRNMSLNQWRKYLKKHHRAAADSPESVQTDWSSAVFAKLGSALTSFLLHVAKVQVSGTDPTTGATVKGHQPAFHHTYQFVQGQRIGIIKLHKNLIKQLGGNEFANSVQPQFLPMLVKPRPWTSHNSGGYLFTPSNLVRVRDSVETIAYVKAAADAHNLDEVYRGLNILGDTAWTVNSKVLDVVSQFWNTGDQFLDIPPMATEPQLPEPLPSHAEPNEKHEYVKKVKAIMNEAAGFRSQRCDMNYKLEIARAYVGEKMYFPHSVDFRGRAYPIPPHFNHLGNDLTRSLFLFWEGRELGERGLRWLKIHLANVYGMDKAPLDEREKFVNDNMDHVLASARDPVHGPRWWTKADKPWQVLAVCFELNEAYKLDDPTKYVSYIPVHQDGTCNGLQHYAALGGDVEGAKQVNLVPAERPQDVYRFVSRLVEKRLDNEAQAGNEIAQFLQGKITRKVVKQTVMTNVYGVTFVGAVAQIEKQLHHIVDTEHISEYARYLTSLVFASMRELFEGAHLIQDWLGETARRISKSVRIDYEETSAKNANKPNHLSSVIWTTPLGLPCVQPYRVNRQQSITTSLQDVIISDPFGASQVDSRKQQAAFPPNFVHSMDATHMLMTATACGEQNLSFAAVHDSYWTHAADVDDMNKNIRRQFVKLHEENAIMKLKQEFERRYKGFLQVCHVPADHEVANRIKEVRKNIVKSLGRAMTVADEVYLEKRRQQLLNSADPKEVEAGKQLNTTVSVTEDYDINAISITPSLRSSLQILAPLKFPDIPKRGNLDVSCVNDSLYFFS